MIGLFLVLIGISLLLGGIFTIRYGLKHLLWNKLQLLLRNATNTPLRGLLLGIIAAALFQSSTAVSLITIGLVSAEYLSFRNALGIILGANIGTCSTVQLMTLSLPLEYLVPLFGISLAFSLVRATRYFALTLTGFIGIFTGLALLSTGLGILSDTRLFNETISLAKTSSLHAMSAGILATFLFQSSSASTGVLMALAEEGMVNLTTAAYIVYGNNIGSCLSSVLISTVAPIGAKRVAVSHILLNVLGVLLFWPVTDIFTNILMCFTTDFPHQIALLHTLFNVLSSLLILPFIKQFASLVEQLVPSS